MRKPKGRVLAVDPGSKNIGLAASDSSGTIANPLQVIRHISLEADVERITTLARELETVQIIVGTPINEEGVSTPQIRHAEKVAEALRCATGLPVQLWDESLTTRLARKTRLEMGVKRAKRRGHLDDLAATILLQSYLDRWLDSDERDTV